MSSRWHQKKEKERLEAEARAEVAAQRDAEVQVELSRQKDISDAAMGKGEDELFERKLTKEEKKAAAKAAREAKKKARASRKAGSKGASQSASGGEEKKKDSSDDVSRIIDEVKASEEQASSSKERNEAAELLASDGTICTFATSKKGVDSRSRDINIQNFTLLHKGTVMLDETEIVLNHGNRYGLIGRNGCGKSTLMKTLGVRAVPIPEGIDIFHLKEEIEPSDSITALDAVMSVDEERARLEKEAERLNHAMSVITEGENNDRESNDGDEDENTMSEEEQQELIMEMLSEIYERLDALDADTAEMRARSILKGLGFTHEMQGKYTRDFSGGWRMRVSLARALFIQPTLLLLDEPTNHLDMEAVIWLEDYLSKWNRILLLISHSQDFLNNVCTHMVHFTNRQKLEYYDGNYDQFVKTKGEKEENQMKQYKWEQDQIKSMKEYIARFGHGTAKNAKQAQSKEKVLEKMIRNGLTEMPEVEKPMNFRFPDPGHLPPPVLAFHDVSFAYTGCQALYSNVNFGVDLDSRVALVGPNGAGKTTLVKLMSGELQPTLGDIRPHGHLKLGRFTQHFVDVLDLDKTPLDFFGELYPDEPVENLRKYLGRFGVSGKMQVQQMEQLSDGQKSRVVFAKLGRDTPHILLLDEPTNHLDMESIDALALAIQEFHGGLVLVSHDMRLISQVAKEIWICDHKTVAPYRGDISHFKMDMRAQMGIDGAQHGSAGGKGKQLRGDASVKATSDSSKKVAKKVKKQTIEVVKSAKPKSKPKPSNPPSVTPAPKGRPNRAGDAWGSDEEDNVVLAAPSSRRYVPPHLRNRG